MTYYVGNSRRGSFSILEITQCPRPLPMHGERANIPDQVGVLNPLHNPEIENVARINRNSVVGSVSIGTNVSKKSKLEEDSTG